MSWIDRQLSRFSYERTKKGVNVYMATKDASWDSLENKIESVQTNPILIPIFEIMNEYLAGARFYVESSSGERLKDHWVLDLLKKPNRYQTKEDFLSQHILYKFGFGWHYMFPIVPTGFSEATEIHNLDSSLVEYPTNIKVKTITGNISEQQFVYDSENQNLKLSFGQVIPFFDQPNGRGDNPLISRSRLDGLHKEITNINKAAIAKNIALQSNGKELFSPRTSGGLGHGMLPKAQQEQMEKDMNLKRGLGDGRSRAFITKSDIRWQSLHIALADLGLDDSTSKDAQTLANAFRIPRDILNYSPEGSNHENQETAKIGFVQDTVTKIISDLCTSLTQGLKLDVKLKGSLDHLPIMEATEMRRTRNLLAYARTLQALVKEEVLSKEEAKSKYLDYEERAKRN